MRASIRSLLLWMFLNCPLWRLFFPCMLISFFSLLSFPQFFERMIGEPVLHMPPMNRNTPYRTNFLLFDRLLHMIARPKLLPANKRLRLLPAILFLVSFHFFYSIQLLYFILKLFINTLVHQFEVRRLF